jgi:hypothetical protein
VKKNHAAARRSTSTASSVTNSKPFFSSGTITKLQ